MTGRTVSAETFGQVIEHTHRELEEYIKGNTGPIKERFSHRDDVTLANPLGPPVRGWEQAAAAADRAAEGLRDGEITFENLMTYETPDLAYIVEVHRFRVK